MRLTMVRRKPGNYAPKNHRKIEKFMPKNGREQENGKL